MNRFLTALCCTLLLSGCAATQAPKKDYSAFRANKPTSILVLPPTNSSLEVEAPLGVLAQSTRPIAEAGYYVFPVALVYETFKQNGLSNPADIHQVPLPKLREIFGADAALYINVHSYGTQYAVLASGTTVALSASLVSLHTGETLWSGERTFSESNNQGGGGLLGMLVGAIIHQVANTLADRSYDVAGVTNELLFSHRIEGGLLPGPRQIESKP